MDVLVNTLSDLAEARGRQAIANALRERGATTEITEYDNWDGGIWSWRITLPLPIGTWGQLEDAERKRVEQELAELVKAMWPGEEHKFEVQLIPSASVGASGISNQGRAHSSNLASLEFEGFLFRSRPERNLFVALRETGMPVMPLPVVASNRERFRRIEPDFVVIRRGMTFIIEVDGDRWHAETPATAQERLRHLEDEGVHVLRVNADDCTTPEISAVTAKDLLMRIDRRLMSR